jgi:hypothetical protein
MFTKKAPPVRTTDPVLLKTKAIEFLNKNYNKYKYDPERSQKIPPTFYILSKLSNNSSAPLCLEKLFVCQ